MTIERDKSDPSITVIHTEQGDIRFNFRKEGEDVDVDYASLTPFKTFDEAGRRELEALMEKTFNPSVESTPQLKTLQAKMNATIIATQAGHALDVATSPNLTGPDTGGGALIHMLNNEGKESHDVVLGMNINETRKAEYKDTFGVKHFMLPEDILRHEMFHFIDPAIDHNMPNSHQGGVRVDTEARAVWSINQFQLADNPPRAQRATYIIPNFTLQPGLAGVDGKMTGPEIPGEKQGYPEPSPTYHRMYPVHLSGQIEHHSANTNTHTDKLNQFLTASGHTPTDIQAINGLVAEKLIAVEKNHHEL